MFPSLWVGLWKNIRKGRGLFLDTRLVIGDGDMISFWHDVLVGDAALKDVYPSIFTIAREHDALVAETTFLGRAFG